MRLTVFFAPMLLISTTGLTACDQREERIERAEILKGAAADQITGLEADSTNATPANGETE